MPNLPKAKRRTERRSGIDKVKKGTGRRDADLGGFGQETDNRAKTTLSFSRAVFGASSWLVSPKASQEIAPKTRAKGTKYALAQEPTSPKWNKTGNARERVRGKGRERE